MSDIDTVIDINLLFSVISLIFHQLFSDKVGNKRKFVNSPEMSQINTIFLGMLPFCDVKTTWYALNWMYSVLLHLWLLLWEGGMTLLLSRDLALMRWTMSTRLKMTPDFNASLFNHIHEMCHNLKKNMKMSFNYFYQWNESTCTPQ